MTDFLVSLYGISARKIHVKNTEYFVYDFSPPESDLKEWTIINSLPVFFITD
jgi:hypothetical protein